MPPKAPVSKDQVSRLRTELARKACDGELVLPQAVREIRNAIDMTQAEFARHFGLTRKQVIDLENGKGNPTLETLKKVSRPFGFQVGFVRTDTFPERLRESD